jgi:hypothetical protein
MIIMCLSFVGALMATLIVVFHMTMNELDMLCGYHGEQGQSEP